jgi:hypothetical protein
LYIPTILRIPRPLGRLNWLGHFNDGGPTQQTHLILYFGDGTSTKQIPLILYFGDGASIKQSCLIGHFDDGGFTSQISVARSSYHRETPNIGQKPEEVSHTASDRSVTKSVLMCSGRAAYMFNL